MSIKRFKSIITTTRLGNDGARITVTEVSSKPESAFLQLPVEVRMLIFKHAFSRTPQEHIETLHYGPHVNSASGLMLTCRQIMDEVFELYHADSVVNLWSQSRHDLLPYQKADFRRKPALLPWIQSRHGIAITKKPQHIRNLALSTMLTRQTSRLCENFLEADILRDIHLDVKDIYLKLCICGALRWLHETPEYIMSFCIALEMFANRFPTLERIHIIYCGQQWPVWIQNLGDVPFPDIAFARHQVRMFSGANWSVTKIDARKRSWGPSLRRDESQVQPPVGSAGTVDAQGTCRLRTVMTWNHTTAHPGHNIHQVPWAQRSVAVDYYDSWTILGERCVLNKPLQRRMMNCDPHFKTIQDELISASETESKRVRPSRLTTRPSGLAKMVTKVKTTVEATPVAPTWGFYKYIPETRAVDLASRSSRYFRY